MNEGIYLKPPFTVPLFIIATIEAEKTDVIESIPTAKRVKSEGWSAREENAD